MARLHLHAIFVLREILKIQSCVVDLPNKFFSTHKIIKYSKFNNSILDHFKHFISYIWLYWIFYHSNFSQTKNRTQV